MKRKVILVVILVIIGCCNTRAAVIDSTVNAFTVRYSDTVALATGKLYAVFTDKIGDWWDPDHTYSGKASNLTIQPFAGGCFCEKLESGGSIQHMTVLYAAPGSTFRMQGGLGPLQQFPVIGIMTLELKAIEKQTQVTLTYAVGGYSPGGVGKFAPVVNMVLELQFKRFLDAAAK
jgi:hypothetical protein